MADAWHGTTVTDNTLDFGPLALIVPLLQQLDIAPIIDRHLPPDPQLAFSHGRILSLLLAARLCQPTALINIPDWAQRTGADRLWDIPALSLNDDRLGRALDAFFTQRHSILASVAAQTILLAELSLDRLHFDPTHLSFHGAYPSSQPRPQDLPWPPTTGGDIPPVHITHGYGDDTKLIQVGVTSIVDEVGAVPILGQCLDGSQNGHTAIQQQCDWLLEEGFLREGSLLISDRGTFSVAHVARLQRHDCHVLCSVPWADYQQLYDTHAASLRWQRASYLSMEQQRRRATGSTLPHEFYDLAVVRHTLTDPQTQEPISCRVLFVHSSADEAICRQTRERDLVRLREGLEAIAATVARSHPLTTQASIARRVTRLFGNRALAVRPVFLKSVRRVEALVCLMQVALTAYQLLERFYRQRVAADADPSELHRTTESLLRVFRGGNPRADGPALLVEPVPLRGVGRAGWSLGA